MSEHLRTILTGQFQASLSMLNQCIRACPPAHWEGMVANQSFRTIAYHSLFFVDFYLSPGEDEFEPRDLHQRGGDERLDNAPIVGLPQEDTMGYVEVCRGKLLETMAAE